MPCTPWHRLLAPRRQRAVGRRRPCLESYRPRLEGLEDRTLLSAFAGGLKPGATGVVRQIVFVDGNVTDPGRFFQGVSTGTEVVLLDGRGDPLQQISNT